LVKPIEASIQRIWTLGSMDEALAAAAALVVRSEEMSGTPVDLDGETPATTGRDANPGDSPPPVAPSGDQPLAWAQRWLTEQRRP
jgi:hypothetical protein